MDFEATIVVMRIDDDLIYFDCENHAGDREVCANISALCNVLVANCLIHMINPVQYSPGRVLIEVKNPTSAQIEIFETVLEAFKALSDKFPDNLRVL